MARYWVGGSGTWDATTTTNWSATSNGAGGASAPTSADDVIFDSFSGAAPTVTIGTNAVCGAVTINAPTSGTLTFAFGTTGVISYNGNWSSPASLFATTGTGNTTAGSIVYVGSGSSTLTTNGYSFPTSFGVTTSAGTLTLGGALTTTNNFIVTQGTFSTSASNYNLSVSTFSSSNSNTRTINLNGSTLTVSNNFSCGAVNNLTFNAGSSTISLSGSGFTAGTISFNNVVTTQSSTIIFTCTNTSFINLTFGTPSPTPGYLNVTCGGSFTVTGTLTIGSTNAYNKRILVNYNGIPGTGTITITAASVATLSDVDFSDITVAGAAAPWSGTRLGNCQGNTNIIFPSAKTVYWNLAGAQVFSAVGWALSSGGIPNANNFPLAQDTAIFDNAGSAGTVTINPGWSIGTIDMSTRTTAMTLSITDSMYFYGSWKNGTGTTLSGTPAIFFSSRLSTQQILSNGIPFTNTIYIYNSTVQLLDAFTTTGSTNFSQGTLDLNNQTFTTIAVSSSNSNARTLAFGSGNIALTGSSLTIWNTGTDTNFTYTGTPTINCTYSGSVGTRTLGTGSAATETYALNFNVSAGSDTVTASQRYGTLNFTGFTGTLNNNTRIIYKSLILSSSMTCTPGTLITNFLATSGTWQITSNNQTLDFPVTFNGLGGTWACTDALTLGSSRTLTMANGILKLKAGVTSTVGSFVTSGSTLKYLQSTTPGTQATLSQASGTATATYLYVQDINVTGGATFTASATTNSNGGNNSGWSSIVAFYASRITKTGILYTPINAYFDEITMTKSSITPSVTYSSTFDEVTLQGQNIAKRETSTGQIQVSGYLDEVTGIY